MLSKVQDLALGWANENAVPPGAYAAGAITGDVVDTFTKLHDGELFLKVHTGTVPGGATVTLTANESDLATGPWTAITESATAVSSTTSKVILAKVFRRSKRYLQVTGTVAGGTIPLGAEICSQKKMA